MSERLAAVAETIGRPGSKEPPRAEIRYLDSVPDDVCCVASTEYCATKVDGSWNTSVTFPSESGERF